MERSDINHEDESFDAAAFGGLAQDGEPVEPLIPTPTLRNKVGVGMRYSIPTTK